MHDQLCSVISLCFGHQTHDCQWFSLKVSHLYSQGGSLLLTDLLKSNRFHVWKGRVHETILVLVALQSSYQRCAVFGVSHCMKGLQGRGMKSKWGQCCTLNQSDQKKKKNTVFVSHHVLLTSYPQTPLFLGIHWTQPSCGRTHWWWPWSISYVFMVLCFFLTTHLVCLSSLFVATLLSY